MSAHDEWMASDQALSCFECWDSTGYFPNRSKVPTGMQLLTATSYAFNTILCDGFDIYFELEAAHSAPEVRDTFFMLGFPEAGAAMATSMIAVCGSTYIRTLEIRRQGIKSAFDTLDAQLDQFSSAFQHNYTIFYDKCEAMTQLFAKHASRIANPHE